MANELGIHDMSGNVWEWCWDWYGEEYYGKSPIQNPTGPANETQRVLRGGDWYSQADRCRVASRNYFSPNYVRPYIGFRVCRTACKIP